jgi:hypothetical protein
MRPLADPVKGLAVRFKKRGLKIESPEICGVMTLLPPRNLKNGPGFKLKTAYIIG